MSGDVRDDPLGFTICMASRGRATKRIRRLPDGGIEKEGYDHVTHWFYEPVRFADLESPADRLRQLATQPDKMIIRGAPIHLSEGPQRRTWARGTPEPTLKGIPQRWIAIDVDDVEVPDGLGHPDRLLDAALYVRDELLPSAFRGVRMVVTPTSSSGLKGGTMARMRLFDRPVSDDELARWAKGARRCDHPVDPAVFRPGQPIYTARPEFVGMPDPVSDELLAIVLPGERDEVAIDIEEFETRTEVIERQVSNWSVGSVGNWRDFLWSELGGETGYFEPLTRALGVAALTDEHEDAIVDFAHSLLQGRADEDRKRKYGPDWLRSTLRRFRDRDRVARQRDREALAEVEAFFRACRAEGRATPAGGQTEQEASGWTLDGAPPWVEELNMSHMFVRDADRVVSLDENGHIRSWMTRQAFAAFHDKRTVECGRKRDGSPLLKGMGSAWLKHPQRRDCERVGVFKADEIRPGDYNLFRGLARQGTDHPWPTIRGFLLDVICGGDEAAFDWLIRWIACLVQRPLDLAETGVVLVGPQGCGKGTLFELLARILGKENVLIAASEDQVFGRFNSGVAGKPLIFLDEAVFGFDRRIGSRLKTQITSPRTR